MSDIFLITDKNGRFIKKGDFTEVEVRMIAKAGYRVYENNKEITEKLTGLFNQQTNTFDTITNYKEQL